MTPRGSAGQAANRGGPARGLARGSDLTLAGAARPPCPAQGPDAGVCDRPLMPSRRGDKGVGVQGFSAGACEVRACAGAWGQGGVREALAERRRAGVSRHGGVGVRGAGEGRAGPVKAERVRNEQAEPSARGAQERQGCAGWRSQPEGPKPGAARPRARNEPAGAAIVLKLGAKLIEPLCQLVELLHLVIETAGVIHL